MDSGAMAATTLGVMASAAVISSMLMRFWIIAFSSSSRSPSSSATLAIALTSSRETTASADFGVMSLESPSTRITRGYIMTMSTEIIFVAKPISDFQYDVPIVLGMISEKTSIRTVVMALTSPARRLRRHR